MKSLSIGCQICILEWFSRRRNLCDQPLGYVKKDAKNKVSFEESIIQTQASTRAWYSHIDGYFMKNDFKRCPFEHSLHQRR